MGKLSEHKELKPGSGGRAAQDAAHEERILRAIRRIIRSVDLYSHRLTAETGMTVPQLACLLRVVQAGPVTLKDLSASVDLSASTLVGIVDRLEAKGLVRRERSSRDRRQVQIWATADGNLVAEAAPSPLQDRLTAALRSLPEVEQAAIAQSLERIVTLMQIREVDAAPILDTGVTLTADAKAGAGAGDQAVSRAQTASAAAHHA